MTGRAGLLLLLMIILLPTTVAASPVILTITGNIRHQGESLEQLEFTLEQLQALPQRELTTAHLWAREPHRYLGPDLALLMETLFGHARITTLHLEGLNGYSVAVDWPALAPHQPILAWQENGKTMSRRDKGPLWLLLPFERLSEPQLSDFRHYMVWQLHKIRVFTEPR
ncbi:molybdopterin-binding protein [Zobellella taiwanensis]|nr:molybdopterin-binding protein [Zobellella taiwanensis]